MDENQERVLINTKTHFKSLDYESYDIESNTQTLTTIPETTFSVHASHPNVFAVASCHGLICLDTGDGSDLYIWNPTTLEHIRIPHPPTPPSGGGSAWGFGYVSETEEYKLVRIPDVPLQMVQLFNFKDNCWKTINLNNEDLAYDIKLFMGHGVEFNNMICWAINWAYDHDALEAHGWDIIGFDLASEEFKLVYSYDHNDFPYGFSNCPLLCSNKDSRCLQFCLQDDEGELSIWCYSRHENDEERYAFKEVFCFRHVSFSMYERFLIAKQMIGLTRTGRYVFHLNDGSIVLLQPDQDQDEQIHFLRIPKTMNVIKYVHSLVSPKHLVGDI